jgi:hypothetical protein
LLDRDPGDRDARDLGADVSLDEPDEFEEPDEPEEPDESGEPEESPAFAVSRAFSLVPFERLSVR